MAVEATPKLYLDVGNRSFEGWLRVHVERSVEDVGYSFGMITTRSWPGLEGEWWVNPGDRVRLRVNDELVVTGWLDHMSPQYSGDFHQIRLSGRGLVSDLVDCCYVGPPNQWKNTDPAEIVRAIAKQHDITVKVETDFGAPMDFAMQQGETCWAAIDRICRLRQVLSYEQPDGSLLITRVSEEVCETKLVQGGNILEATGTLDDKDRFSHYIVKGQQKGKKSSGETATPEQAAQSIGEVVDESMRRYRPKVVVQSADTNNDNALKRAQWEKQNRWGNGRTAEITVMGWLRPNGKTWQINQLCDVEDAWLGLDRRLAITRTTINISEAGLRTVLTLQPPEALIPEPPDPKKEPKAKGKGGKGGGPSFWYHVGADWTANEERRRESKQ